MRCVEGDERKEMKGRSFLEDLSNAAMKVIKCLAGVLTMNSVGTLVERWFMLLLDATVGLFGDPLLLRSEYHADIWHLCGQTVAAETLVVGRISRRADTGDLLYEGP